MRTLIAGLLLLVAGSAFAQQSAIDQRTMLACKGQAATQKSFVIWYQLGLPLRPTPVASAQAYAVSAGGMNNPQRMAAGDQEKARGDSEDGLGDPFITQGMTFESQGNYKQAMQAYAEAEKHFTLSVGGYTSAINWYEMAIR